MNTCFTYEYQGDSSTVVVRGTMSKNTKKDIQGLVCEKFFPGQIGLPSLLVCKKLYDEYHFWGSKSFRETTEEPNIDMTADMLVFYLTTTVWNRAYLVEDIVGNIMKVVKNNPLSVIPGAIERILLSTLEDEHETNEN